MNETITTILVLLFIHYVSDFILQTRYMAENKSKDITALLYHIYAYATGLSVGLTIYSYFCQLNSLPALAFIVANVLAHFCIDFSTSRMNTYFFTHKQMNFFWWGIGFDQFLHTGIIVLTTPLLLK